MRPVLWTLPAWMRVTLPSIRPALSSACETLSVVMPPETISPPARLVRFCAPMPRLRPADILPLLSRLPAMDSVASRPAASTPVLFRLPFTIKPRSPCDCSVPVPVNALVVTDRRWPAATLPASFASVPTVMSAVPPELIRPAAFCNWLAFTVITWLAASVPRVLSIAPALMVTVLPTTPRGWAGLPDGVSVLSRFDADRDSTLLACSRPPTLSIAPGVVTVRSLAIILPPRLMTWLPLACNAPFVAMVPD
ncbi:hypothetical protein BOSP111201_04030 [Bordetella sputigena]